ncbi:MAG: DUF4870 domain-containing protein [Phycisphaerae bacterium]|jgi:uncharacterized protein|nr:DUF4870 domain-containing protein [Phycisphaerae bacterium]
MYQKNLNLILEMMRRMLASLLLRTGHLIGSVVPFASLIIPLVLINTVGKEDDFVKQNAKEALNLLLFAVIVGIISIPLCFVIIGFFILIALSLFVFIFSIIAAIQTMSAKQGDAPYKYPIIFRLIS